MVSPAVKGKKPNQLKMGMKNIGNFGRKVSEYNAQRRDRNLEKLRVKANNAEEEKKKLDEAQKLKGKVQETKDVKKQMNQEKLEKVKSAVGQLKKVGGSYENKGNKMDVLGNNQNNTNKDNNLDVLGNGTKKETPKLFGNGGNFKL